MFRSLALLLSAAALAVSTSAKASDEDAELWLNPSVSFDLDGDTGLELETAQRFRDAERGRDDTYFFRLWINQDLSEDATLSGAVERRINNGGSDETRLIQQLSASKGILRARARLEQRFVEGADRMGLRFRPRLGVSVPLDAAERLSFRSDAELFWTLQSTSEGGDDGLTGLRTQIGFDYDVSDRFAVGLAYLRQQDFNSGEADTVGHAPIVTLEFAL